VVPGLSRAPSRRGHGETVPNKAVSAFAPPSPNCSTWLTAALERVVPPFPYLINGTPSICYDERVFQKNFLICGIGRIKVKRSACRFFGRNGLRDYKPAAPRPWSFCPPMTRLYACPMETTELRTTECPGLAASRAGTSAWSDRGRGKRGWATAAGLWVGKTLSLSSFYGHEFPSLHRGRISRSLASCRASTFLPALIARLGHQFSTWPGFPHRVEVFFFFLYTRFVSFHGVAI
jgi:hypothetical protein